MHGNLPGERGDVRHINVAGVVQLPLRSGRRGGEGHLPPHPIGDGLIGDREIAYSCTGLPWTSLHGRLQLLPPKPLPVPLSFFMKVVPEICSLSVPAPPIFPRTSAQLPLMRLPLRVPLNAWVQDFPLSALIPTHQMVVPTARRR